MLSNDHCNSFPSSIQLKPEMNTTIAYKILFFSCIAQCVQGASAVYMCVRGKSFGFFYISYGCCNLYWNCVYCVVCSTLVEWYSHIIVNIVVQWASFQQRNHILFNLLNCNTVRKREKLNTQYNNIQMNIHHQLEKAIHQREKTRRNMTW